MPDVPELGGRFRMIGPARLAGFPDRLRWKTAGALWRRAPPSWRIRRLPAAPRVPQSIGRRAGRIVRVSRPSCAISPDCYGVRP